MGAGIGTLHLCAPVLTVCPRLFPAETPIEEFVPTPAFPALQYLESVDQGGVAWRAGLRTGDFLIEVSAGRLSPEQPAAVVLTGLSVVQVNGSDVVKVGHRQVVSLIRQGGSRLLMKVVSVSRKSESNLVRKKGAWWEGAPGAPG